MESIFDPRPDSSDDPRELLSAVNSAKRKVESLTPKEWKVFAFWGCWILVFVPPFDFLNGNRWWTVVVASSVLGGVITTIYLRLGSRRIHWMRQYSWRIWPGIGLFYGIIMALAIIEQSRFQYVWTAAALSGALPYFVAAIVIRNRERHCVTP